MNWFKKTNTHLINIDNGQELKLVRCRNAYQIHLTNYGILRTFADFETSDEDLKKAAEEFYEKLVSKLEVVDI